MLTNTFQKIHFITKQKLLRKLTLFYIFYKSLQCLAPLPASVLTSQPWNMVSGTRLHAQQE